MLDIGCGTGELLRLARDGGHSGRLCGLDPAAAMLAVAQRRTDIDWLLGAPLSVHLKAKFDLVVMTGHAFQVWLEDDELRASLAAVRGALVEGGRFVFETRNPSTRAWEAWTPEHAVEFVYDGARFRMAHQIEMPLSGDRVSFGVTFTSPAWERPEQSRSTLRFLSNETLALFLHEAGFKIESQYGDWDRQPLTDESPEIITVARPE